jgi:hypothetical protein
MRKDVQWFQFLVPLRHLSLNLNVYSLRRSLRVGYGDKELSLEENIFLDRWDIMGSNN